MQRLMRWSSLAVFALLNLFLVCFGIFYATTDTMLGFHAAAIPEEMRAGVLPLYLALMKLVGGASAALGALGFFVTFTLVRTGSSLAAVAVTLAIALPVLVAAYVAETLAARTGAPTSWHLMGIVIGAACVAYALHWGGAGRR